MGSCIPGPLPAARVPHPIATPESEVPGQLSQLSQLSRTVLEEAQAVSCPRSPPSPAVVPASPRLVTCSGGRRAPLPALEGGPGHAGSGQGRRPGPRRRGSPLLCLPPLSAAGVGGRRAGWGGRGRREGRSGAGPPPFSFHSHGQGPRPAPARARVQPGLPPETHPETPTPRTSRAARPPLWLTHSVSASGTPALGRDPSSRTQLQTRQLKTGCAQSGEVAAQGWWRINEPSAEGLL